MPPASSDPTISEQVKQKIQHDLNERSDLKHNYGQPKRAPHAGADHQVTGQFQTDCSKQHGESLQCIERNYQNRSACEPFFQAYKACRKEENDRRLEANAARAQNGGGWFF
jgi:hypothetical protein